MTPRSRNDISGSQAPRPIEIEPQRHAVVAAFARHVEALEPAALEALQERLTASDAGGAFDLGEELRRISLPGGSVHLFTGTDIGPVDSQTAAAALDDITRDDGSGDWASSELLGAAAAVARLNIAASTLANWRAGGHVVAFRRDRRNFLYPMRQFVRGMPTAGLAEIVRRFPSVEDAWEWLVQSNAMTAGAPPLDRLQAGRIDEVQRAAEGALDFA